MTRKKTTQPDEDIQRLGHQIASSAGIVVVALVNFGVPLTPDQQSSILSLIITGWAMASTIYSIRYRVVTATTRSRSSDKPRQPRPPRTPPTSP